MAWQFDLSGKQIYVVSRLWVQLNKPFLQEISHETVKSKYLVVNGKMCDEVEGTISVQPYPLSRN